ncbi:MAG: hypothetical protein ACYDAA_08760 [Syntrophales bacterium]
MNGIRYWECRKNEWETGVLNEEEADAVPVTGKLTAAKKSRGKKAGWKGPGTLWIAKAEDPLRKS